MTARLPLAWNDDTKRMRLGLTKPKGDNGVHEVWIIYTITKNGYMSHTYKSGDGEGQDEKISIQTAAGYELDLETVPVEIADKIQHDILGRIYKKIGISVYVRHFGPLESYAVVKANRFRSLSAASKKPKANVDKTLATNEPRERIGREPKRRKTEEAKPENVESPTKSDDDDGVPKNTRKERPAPIVPWESIQAKMGSWRDISKSKESREGVKPAVDAKNNDRGSKNAQKNYPAGIGFWKPSAAALAKMKKLEECIEQVEKEHQKRRAKLNIG